MSECVSSDEVDALARYRVNPANISDAIEVSNCLQNSGENPRPLIDTLSIVFREKERLQCGSRLTKKDSAEPRFDIALLNTDHDAAGICSALSAFSGTSGKGCTSMLFWGAPGTGKTAFAKYLAEALSLELMEKRASDLVSMWKVAFRETLPEHRVKLGLAYFPQVKLSQTRAKEIESIEGITPGDMAVLYNRYRLSDLSDPDGNKPADEIQSEIAYRKYGERREIGFTK